MKMLILAIDGLQKNVVEKLNLKNFLQKYNGELDIPLVDKYNTGKMVAFSPIVWTAFLTGRWKADVDHFYRWNFNLMNVIKKRFPFLKGKGLGRLLSHVGAREVPQITEFPTIFSGKNRKFYNFICLGWNKKKWAEACNMFFDHKFSLQELLNRWRKLRDAEAKEFLEDKRKYNLLGFYTAYLDYFGHFFFKDYNRHILFDAYREMNDWIGRIIKQKDYDCNLIISDHGFDNEGNHSEKGFWSCNVCLNPIPKKITDFYNLIAREKSEISKE